MNIGYPLHLLDWQEFENLTVQICHSVIGIGVTSFSAGKDGGRDARFEGEAENFPSKSEPWKGKIIVQAKNTGNPIASCSDSDFIKLIENEELPKISKLQKRNEIDCYLILTNRKLTAQAEEKIRKLVTEQTGISKFSILGKELIDIYLSEFPEIVQRLGLSKIGDPIVFYEKDIVDIINIFSDDFNRMVDGLVLKKDDLKYLDKEEKNKKNQLGQKYFDFIKQNSLAYFSKIELFLKDPKNHRLLNKYKDFTTEVNNKIIIRRDQFDAFENIFEFIFNYITQNNTSSLNSRRFIWVFLHFMYFNCDIGEK